MKSSLADNGRKKEEKKKEEEKGKKKSKRKRESDEIWDNGSRGNVIRSRYVSVYQETIFYFQQNAGQESRLVTARTFRGARFLFIAEHRPASLPRNLQANETVQSKYSTSHTQKRKKKERRKKSRREREREREREKTEKFLPTNWLVWRELSKAWVDPRRCTSTSTRSRDLFSLFDIPAPSLLASKTPRRSRRARRTLDTARFHGKSW